MQPLIPEFLDFVQKADHGAEIKGVWPLSRMPRFAAMLLDDSGNVQVDLQFGRHGKLRTMGGELSADLTVTCQRCLQAMQYPLQARMSLALINDDAQAEALPAEFEPLLLEADEKMNLAAVIEDELLLTLPLVLVHEHDCSDFLQQQVQRQKQEAAKAAEQKAKNNPFAVLKDLRKE